MSFTEERRARIRYCRERYKVRRDVDLHPHVTQLIYTEWPDVAHRAYHARMRRKRRGKP